MEMTKWRARFRPAVAAALLLLALHGVSIGGYAQVSRAQINGTVRDPSGGSVPGAAVVLRNLDTGVETRTATNEQGVYVILYILPGNYTLEAGKEGFATARVQPFSLVVNQASVFDIVLPVGQVADSITVEAVGAQVQSASAELGNVVVRKQLDNLPFGTNIENLMRLTAGVNAVKTGQSSIPSVNGQINRSSMYMLDGVNNQATFYGNLGVNPIIDTLEEFKVQSHNDSVEFGGVMGGVINTATKAGTNELHGSAWETLQNDALNARNSFEAKVNPYKGHIFGGTLGGPVYLPKLYNGTNRTFFFAGYQVSLSRSPALAYMRVPTEANLQGDLSDWPMQIYDPFSTRENRAQPGTFVRDPFPGNRVPVSAMNPGMLYFARTVLPQPEYIGIGDYNAVNRTARRYSTHSLSTRIDHKFNDYDSIWGRYTASYIGNTLPGGIPAIENRNDGRSHNLGVSWVHTFGPSAVLQAQFGRVFSWDATVGKYGDLPSEFMSKVGYSSNVLNPYIDGKTYIPAFAPSGFFSAGELMNNVRPGDSTHERIGYSKLHGRHTLKFGGEHNWIAYHMLLGRTDVNFAAAQTADPMRLATTGSPLASFLLDVPDNAYRRDIRETTPRWGGVIGFYVQDSWKATNALTLNLGLRYDRTFIPTAGTDSAGNNMVGNMDFDRGLYILQKMAPNCAQAGKPPCIPAPPGAPTGWLPDNVVVSPTGKIFTDTKKNFQPRVGLAYRVGKRTALRASGGVFFDNYSGVTQLARNFAGTWPSLGFQAASNMNYPTAAQPTPAISGLNPLPSAVLPLADPFAQVNYFADPNWKNAYSIQWNAGFQHQLTSSVLLTINYVGSGNRRTTVGGRYGVAMTPGPGNWKLRARFPYMTVPYSWDRSWGSATYNGLQASLERRWAQGLAFSASYTWSKAIDAGSSGFFGVEGNSIQNPYDMGRDRSVSSYDLTHNLVLSWVYDLPFGANRALRTGNRVLDYVLGNWQLNGISDIRSGVPVNLTVSGDIANTGNSNYMRPNVVGDWRLDHPTPARWFNKDAFAAPAAFTFGNAGRNVLRSDGVHRFDLSIFRQVPIGERMRAEIRLEAFNAFNTVTYNAPTSAFTSVNFGKVLSAMAARSVQARVRLTF